MGILDVVTIAVILIVVAALVAFVLWLAALPGKIAAGRNHPQAEAITCCGWLSLITCFGTWPIAMIWAYTRPLHVSVDQEAPRS